MEYNRKKMLIGMLILIAGLMLIINVNAAFVPSCSDGVDNDLDGAIDYPDDSGCRDSGDNDENVILGYADGCLVKGDTLMDVFGEVNYECGGDRCPVCVMISEAGNYTTHSARCSGLPSCGFSGGGGHLEVDLEPPTLIVNSPDNGDNYDSRKVLFDLACDGEICDFYYLDNINGRGRWKKLANNKGSYYKKISFKDGFNSVTIKAVDMNNNPVNVTREFRVDSKEPRIKKTYPKKKKFASGLFEVQFSEVNPERLELVLAEVPLSRGDVGDELERFLLDIENDCELVKKKYYCDIDVALDSYNGEDIEYYFVLEDIVGNVARSKKVMVSVDTEDPVILNLEDFWMRGEGRYERYVYFNISIDEENFDEAVYFYVDNRGRLRDKRLCSRLRDNVCTVKKSFRSGETLLNVTIFDDAGNYAVGLIEEDIVY